MSVVVGAVVACFCFVLLLCFCTCSVFWLYFLYSVNAYIKSKHKWCALYLFLCSIFFFIYAFCMHVCGVTRMNHWQSAEDVVLLDCTVALGSRTADKFINKQQQSWKVFPLPVRRVLALCSPSPPSFPLLSPRVSSDFGKLTETLTII